MARVFSFIGSFRIGDGEVATPEREDFEVLATAHDAADFRMREKLARQIAYFA